MNSKEALDKLYMAVDEELLYEQSGYIFATELTKVIEQDLERLEQLEKENQNLKEVMKNREEGTIELIKAIKILNDKFKFELGVSVVKEKYCYSLEFLFNNQYFSITKEQYELLKQVFESVGDK